MNFVELWQNHWKSGVFSFIRHSEKLSRKNTQVLQESLAVLVPERLLLPCTKQSIWHQNVKASKESW